MQRKKKINTKMNMSRNSTKKKWNMNRLLRTKEDREDDYEGEKRSKKLQSKSLTRGKC